MSKHAGLNNQPLSVSALARLFRLDRGTIARRLEQVTPSRADAKGKFYLLEEAAPAIARPAEASPAAAVRQEKLESEAALLRLKLDKERGETLSKREVFDYALRLFRAIHLRFGVRLPREISEQLYRAESAAHIADILGRETGRILNELKQDQHKLVQEAEGDEDAQEG